MNLYRKYRPQKFSDIVQQEFAVKTLKNILITRRIAHAYLFNGPRGTGKTSLAKVFAKALNCLDDTSYEPCLKCKNCLDFDEGKFIDYFEIDAASRGKVQEMRDLIDKVKYAPAQGKYKVYVLDESHMLSAGASNAFLKTLEEPPEHVIFILATTDPHKILPTIKSRCQVFDFTRIGVKAIKERLEYVCSVEKIKISDQALDYISYYAEGGLRDALSILDQLWAYSEDEIDESVLAAVFGTTGYEKVYSYIKAVFEKDFKKILEFGNEYYENGVDFKLFTEDILKVLKDIIYLKWSSSHKVVLPFLAGYRDEIQAMDDLMLHSFLERLNNEYYQMRKSEDMKLALELVIYDFIKRPLKKEEKRSSDIELKNTKVVEKEEPENINPFKISKMFKEKIEEKRPNPNISKKTKAKKIKKENKDNYEPTEDELVLINAFDLVLSNLERESLFIGSCLRKSEIRWAEDKKSVVVYFGKGHNFHFERTLSKKEILQDELMQILGKELKLDIILVENKKLENEKQQNKKENNQKIDKTTENKEDVQETLERLSEEDELLRALKKNIKVKKIEIMEDDKNGKKT